MKKYKKILKIFFVIMDILALLSIQILPRMSLFSIKTPLVLIGYGFIRFGAWGLLDKKIIMARGADIKYRKDSTSGKVANIVNIVIGALLILCWILI